MNFFKRLHLIITDRKALFLFATVETGKATTRYILQAVTAAIIIASFAGAIRVVKELPSQLEQMFGSLKIENGILQGDSAYTVPKWQIRDAMQSLMAYDLDEKYIPDNFISVLPDPSVNRDSLYFVLEREGLDMGMGDSSFLPSLIEWELLVGEDNLPLTKDGTTGAIRRNFFSFTIVLLLFSTVDLFRNSVYMILVLFILIHILGRRIPVIKIPAVKARLIAFGMTPYFLLIPLFAVAGVKGELLPDIALLCSALLISRTIAQVQIRKKEEQQ